VRSFGVIWIRISDPRSLGSWCIKGTDESTLVMDSSVPLMNHDPSDLGSLILIQITSKERTLKFESSAPAKITAELAGFRRFTWEHFFLLVIHKIKGTKPPVQTGYKYHFRDTKRCDLL